jgi:NodT family efflux transporter outer membrane factor (OMF) lipoprotein
MVHPYLSGMVLRRVNIPVAFIFMMACIAGCVSVGPDYGLPVPDLPCGWRGAGGPAIIPGEKMVRQWWRVFNDPVLTGLIEEAALANLDLKIAVERVNEARKRLGYTVGEQLPKMDANGSITRKRGSDNSTGLSGTETFIRPGVEASWELDLFGRIGRSVEAATADFQAVKEDRTDVMITLFAEVARVYLGLRTFQARLAAARGDMDSRKQILSLTRSRLKHGMATELEVAQAQRELALSEAEMPLLRIEIVRAVNTLGILLNCSKGGLDWLKEARPIPLPPCKAMVGVPVNLLRQRPDIRRAERRLAARTARIGVATADLYPAFFLSGALGLESMDAGDLVAGSSRFFSLGPSVRWHLFDRRRIRERIGIEESLTRQAMLEYEKRVLNALNEVENSLTAYVELRIRLEALDRSVQASQKSLELAVELYKQGLKGFENVLDAQQAVFIIENRLAIARGKSAVNFVGLYKALGGGWAPGADVFKLDHGEKKR